MRGLRGCIVGYSILLATCLNLTEGLLEHFLDGSHATSAIVAGSRCAADLGKSRASVIDRLVQTPITDATALAHDHGNSIRPVGPWS